MEMLSQLYPEMCFTIILRIFNPIKLAIKTKQNDREIQLHFIFPTLPFLIFCNCRWLCSYVPYMCISQNISLIFIDKMLEDTNICLCNAIQSNKLYMTLAFLLLHFQSSFIILYIICSILECTKKSFKITNPRAWEKHI